MRSASLLGVFGTLGLIVATAARGEIKPVVGHNDSAHASPAFKFENVPSPSQPNAAAGARFTVIDGESDENGGTLAVLHDGKLPDGPDQPEANFFFNAGSKGGRILVDLHEAIPLTNVNTYSWHPSSRAAQVYTLYAADGKAEGFKAQPGKEDPSLVGWKRIAKVDTRPKSGRPGGQYGVSISNSDGPLGEYRYLLFDVSRTESDDEFGNTFYSEIVVVAAPGARIPAAVSETNADAPFVTQSTDGYCRISIDTADEPSLKDWAEQKLAPVLAEWYPKLTTMMASDGFTPPKHFDVVLAPGSGVAATGGTKIRANSNWLKRELDREAIGALLHEEVHVVQQYHGRHTPGWLVEGIPDYIRWFKYEPQSHGADAVFFARHKTDLNYDGRYRITANFLNYTIERYDKDQKLLTKINAACRQGTYKDELWQDYTGRSLPELNDEWKVALEKQIADLRDPPPTNTLTDAEKAAGWKLLFNGKDFTGWHNFKNDGVRPGWQVKDGALVCADPHTAGDIVTSNQFDWFELQLDYNISTAGNSGIMFHVTDEGNRVWATGPEFQLEDNVAAADKIRCGWLYALYQPPDDPKTGKPLDATKPVGEWNHVRLLVSPDKCEHDINGVKYFEYVLGSDDFNSRIAKSKFSRMPHFAKSNTGYIALQGDHGSVSFHNIKIRPIPAKPSGG